MPCLSPSVRSHGSGFTSHGHDDAGAHDKNGGSEVTYTRLAVGFIVRFREHRSQSGSLLGGPFLHVGVVDRRGLRRFLAGGGFSVGLKRRIAPDGTVSYYGAALKYGQWRRPEPSDV
jgi:hypothetical protein